MVDEILGFFSTPSLKKNLFVLFQDVLDSKNSAIKDLQYELARVCKVNDVFYSVGHDNFLFS